MQAGRAHKGLGRTYQLYLELPELGILLLRTAEVIVRHARQ